ncbi:MAG: type II toxin-antitoxin system VapC family toxin [Lamprobacter sp.]|uniref:type II toxin-antitoxin system VapC family toxin n=1 Tax=Lamprobacter sp. TaxID=3100796 RepID=UPI002B257E02|nr:type II toxin-antitoxin system VapC family toxin [Lamprobacter sp.]MEA3640746.1 type II toxin-antitoxin system VapC family toxin [Lamprobacter sp.]
MHYVDTSVLIAYLTPEEFSEQADQALRTTAYQPLLLSAWTETELVSALGIKCRTEQIDENDADAALAKYQEIRDRFVHLSVMEQDYHSAAQLLRHWRLGLRAGDALHLAVARRHASVILSLDKVLVKAAQVLGPGAINPSKEQRAQAS